MISLLYFGLIWVLYLKARDRLDTTLCPLGLTAQETDFGRLVCDPIHKTVCLKSKNLMKPTAAGVTLLFTQAAWG